MVYGTFTFVPGQIAVVTGLVLICDVGILAVTSMESPIVKFGDTGKPLPTPGSLSKKNSAFTISTG